MRQCISENCHFSLVSYLSFKLQPFHSESDELLDSSQFFQRKKLKTFFQFFFSVVTKHSCDWSSEDLISSVQLGTPWHSPVDVGVAAEEDGRPEIAIFKENFLKIPKFSIFQYFQNKVTEIRGEIGICGYVGLTHLNPSLLSKLGVDAPASRYRAGTHNHFQKLTPLG